MEKKREATRAKRQEKEEEEATDRVPGTNDDHEQELAAMKIQSCVRGKQARHV